MDWELKYDLIWLTVIHFDPFCTLLHLFFSDFVFLQLYTNSQVYNHTDVIYYDNSLTLTLTALVYFLSMLLILLLGNTTKARSLVTFHQKRFYYKTMLLDIKITPFEAFKWKPLPLFIWALLQTNASEFQENRKCSFLKLLTYMNIPAYMHNA